ncbi:hypothetical protein [Agrococcus sp. SGAir0287]|uniref:hypothetical protein n=1 Tax=Agrococcus sp. SGAir0287 TaxID=2070347 RepID=UPI0010CD5C56|nr:hypothetical protein [Agrococcus sp. SGAir0287]QCR19159.1 hypothetical protein C1N71_06665 [Agrococcus sp. SGAir0287]
MARTPTEIGIQRTTLDASALVVERTTDGSGRRGETMPGTGRRIAVGLAMLVGGLVAAMAALGVLGARVGATAEAVRGTSQDATAAYFLGTAGSGAELALVIGLMALAPVGIVLAAIGCRRVTDDGPSLPAVHIASSPNGIIGRHAEQVR